MLQTYTRDFARLRWKMLLAIQRVLQESGGIIFGGYVRDRIIHDHHADAFYLKMRESSSSSSSSSSVKHAGEPSLAVAYDDPRENPESWPWRATMPNDIDVAMSTDRIAVAKEALDREGYTAVELFDTAASIYCDNPDAAASRGSHGIRHRRLTVEVKLHPLVAKHTTARAQMPAIRIDVLYKDSFVAEGAIVPFGTVDYECNSLVLRPDNGYDLLNTPTLCNPLHRAKTIARIIDDIVHLRAVAVKPAMYRTSLMLSKGFSVTDGVITLLALRPLAPPMFRAGARDSGHADDEVCIMCQGCLRSSSQDAGAMTYSSSSSVTKRVVVKNNCCGARYHAGCYCDSLSGAQTQYDNAAKCMMCRRDMPSCGPCATTRAMGFRLIGVPAMAPWANPEQPPCRGGCGFRRSQFDHLRSYLRLAAAKQHTGSTQLDGAVDAD